MRAFDILDSCNVAFGAKPYIKADVEKFRAEFGWGTYALFTDPFQEGIMRRAWRTARTPGVHPDDPDLILASMLDDSEVPVMVIHGQQFPEVFILPLEGLADSAVDYGMDGKRRWHDLTKDMKPQFMDWCSRWFAGIFM